MSWFLCYLRNMKKTLISKIFCQKALNHIGFYGVYFLLESIIMANQSQTKTTIDPEEIANFSAQAEEWWDENGAFKPLHKLNPVRLQYIRTQICQHFEKDALSCDALKDISLLDIGCGGGLVAEPLARTGAVVTGIDASEENIKTAQAHAKASGIAKKNLTYKAISAEELHSSSKKRYDVVTASEIVEHVADLDLFIASAAGLLKPGGLLIVSTLNRTPKSFALGIVAAEYILRWVPRGTHSWKKFVRPSELARGFRANNLTAEDLTGLVYNPLNDQFSLHDKDIAVNYFMTAIKHKDTKRASKQKK